jgi:methyl-accepting chemotaxis protein
MTAHDIIPGFEARLALHRIDDDVRAAVAEFWPVFAPHLDRAIDELIDAMTGLPSVGSIINAANIVREHRETIREIETAHFKILLSGDLDRRYAESCRHTVQQETALGLDARLRCTGGSFVLSAALQALERKRFLSSRKLLQTVRVLSQVIDFDIANAMTLHREAATRAASARRNAVDEAIVGFSTAVAEVLKAIDEASLSLTSTCTRIKSAADNTLDRMTSASSASTETSQRVKATAAASEELSASILEISNQASRGLAMAKSAVQDAGRAQHTIRSLNDTAERIGAVVDAISAVASQTNLLALNATIEAARAGEAGRGFAVVAAEVKALANQTSHATSDISLQIAAIQTATKGSMTEIDSISQAIAALSAVSTSIASAVQQQGMTTRDIAESVHNAATHTAKASAEINLIKEVTAQNVGAIDEITAWTARLSASAADLEARVAAFFNNVRTTSGTNDWDHRAVEATR